MGKRSFSVLAMASTLLLSGGCGKKKGAEIEQPQIVEADVGESLSAEEQKAQYEKATAIPKEGAKAPEPELAWGVLVSSTAKEVVTVAVECNDKFLKALKPEELLLGRPALMTDDGVVGPMDQTCGPLKEELARGLKLMEGRHPQTDAFLEKWTLIADLYSRIWPAAVNFEAPAKQRKKTVQDLQEAVPELTRELIPALQTAALPLLKFTQDEPQGYAIPFQKMGKAEALTYCQGVVEKTSADLRTLYGIYRKRGADLERDERWARRRYLAFVDTSWKARLGREREVAARLSTGDSGFDAKLREVMKEFYGAADEWTKNAWDPGIKAFEDRTLINIEQMDLAEKAYKKEDKKLERSLKKLATKWPKV